MRLLCQPLINDKLDKLDKLSKLGKLNSHTNSKTNGKAV